MNDSRQGAVVFITVGRRDIQISPSIADNVHFANLSLQQSSEENGSYIIAKTRSTGKYLEEHFSELSDFLEYPIIEPSLKYIKRDLENSFSGVTEIFLIATDQQSGQFSENDTLHFAHIIGKLIKRNFEGNYNTRTLLVRENVSKLDSTYDFFSTELSRLEPEGVLEHGKRLYYHAQGGIDSINFSLLIKLLEYKPDLVLLNKPEGSAISRPILFPEKFIKSSNRQKTLFALERFHFQNINEFLTADTRVIHLAAYASRRLALDFSGAIHHAHELLKADADQGHRIEELCEELIRQLDTPMDGIVLQKEMYLSAKVKFRQEEYADFLWRLFALSESLLVPYIEKEIGKKIFPKSPGSIREWRKFLNSNPLIKSQLSANPKLDLDHPSRHAFRAIYELVKKPGDSLNDLTEINESLDKLNSLRNRIAHRLAGISRKDLDAAISPENLDELNDKLDVLFELGSSDYGVYALISDKIKMLLAGK